MEWNAIKNLSKMKQKCDRIIKISLKLEILWEYEVALAKIIFVLYMLLGLLTKQLLFA